MRTSFSLSKAKYVDEDNQLFTPAQIRKRLKIIFRRYIGKDNAVTIVELFKDLFGEMGMKMNIYQKMFWWEIVKRVMRELRSEGELFTIRRGNHYYILQTENELETFKKNTDLHIGRLHKLKQTANDWVTEAKWKNI